MPPVRNLLVLNRASRALAFCAKVRKFCLSYPFFNLFSSLGIRRSSCSTQANKFEFSISAKNPCFKAAPYQGAQNVLRSTFNFTSLMLREVRMRFGIKNKNSRFYFVLLSTFNFTSLSLREVRMRFGIKNKNCRFYFVLRSTFTNFDTRKRLT